MQKDFHYYLTYMAARSAGYEKSLSHLIAEYNEIVDEVFNRDPNLELRPPTRWVKGKWTPKHISKGYCHRTAYSAMSKLHFMKAEGSKPEKAMPWIAFHFLPGLGDHGPYRLDYDGHEKALEEAIETGYFGTRKAREGKAALIQRLKTFRRLRAKGGRLKWDYEQQLMCWPNSPCSKLMMEDLERIARVLDTRSETASGLEIVKRCCAAPDVIANSDGFESVLSLFDKEIRKQGETDGLCAAKFLKALTGVRMHTFNDTWSHQGFAGIRTVTLNDVSSLQCFYRRNGTSQQLPWKPRIPDAWDLTYFGHGRADLFPDHPSIRLHYIRPGDAKPIDRNNPPQYAEAYRKMVAWFARIGRLAPGWRVRGPVPRGFSPKAINEEFFRALRRPGGKKGYDEKKHRCDFLRRYVQEHDDFQLSAFSTKEPDFQIIWQMFKRSEGKVDLAYFNIAAMYHERWFEKQVTRRFGDIAGDTKDEVKKANDMIRRVIGPAKDFETDKSFLEDVV